MDSSTDEEDEREEESGGGEAASGGGGLAVGEAGRPNFRRRAPERDRGGVGRGVASGFSVVVMWV